MEVAGGEGAKEDWTGAYCGGAAWPWFSGHCGRQCTTRLPLSAQVSKEPHLSICRLAQHLISQSASCCSVGLTSDGCGHQDEQPDSYGQVASREEG